MKSKVKIKEVKKITKSDRTIDLTGFKMQDHLNPKIWGDNQKLRPEIKKNLLKIADDYFEGLELEGVDIDDITFTGSLANYNWSQYSDVDLHILIDYKEVPVDENLVQDFLKTKSTSWNNNHDIKIYGYDVELYVQDISEEHVSTGVYSILYDKWLTQPSRKKITVDNINVKLKSNRIMDSIDDLYDEMKDEKNYDTVVKKADKIKDKIKKMRQAGLDEVGEFSVENMVFKVLRRNGMLERLSDIKTVAYDKSVSLSESLKESFGDFNWVDEIPELSPCEQFILDKLSECELVGLKKRPGWTKYVNKNGDFLFLDNINTGTDKPILYADYDKIWLKCKEMGVSYEEFQKICKHMLYETHERKVSTAFWSDVSFLLPLYETHERKVSTAEIFDALNNDKLYEVHKRKGK
jgi:hypothetical protein